MKMKNKLIKALKSNLTGVRDDGLILSLIYLGDSEAFNKLTDEIKKTRGRYFLSENVIDAIGDYECKDHSCSVSLLTEIIINSNSDVAYLAANALLQLLSRVTKIEEITPILKLLNYYESIITPSSIDRPQIGFNVLTQSKNPLCATFLIQYALAEHSQQVNFLKIAKILPAMNCDIRVIQRLFEYVKNCKHSYTTELALESAQHIDLPKEKYVCEIIIDLIKDDLRWVDSNQKGKVMKYAFTALGNICGDQVPAFIIDSMSNVDLKQYVPYAIKKMCDKHML